MTPFKFPPPPPPPPKASANDAQDQYTSQRGGHSDGRGGRSRGRGFQGRGRGSNNFRGGTRGGHEQPDGRMNGNGRGRGHTRGGHQNDSRGGYQRHRQQNDHSQQQQHQQNPQYPLQTGLPNVSTNIGAMQPQVDPMAFAQAMVFMSTPAGVQTMANFANQMATAADGPYQQSQFASAYPQHSQSPRQFSPPQHAGQKRKRNDRPNTSQGHSSTHGQSQKPPRAKAAPPPPVPSFGFSLPQTHSSQPISTFKTNIAKLQKKRRVNLGLTHYDVEEEETAEEEDIDEEAVFAANFKGEGAVFEHNGENISLQTPAELAAWVKDRRRNFPTQKRIAEKAEEAASKREGELEFLRKIKGKSSKKKAVSTHNAEQEDEESRRKSQGKQEELAQLRKKLQESVARKKEASGENAEPSRDAGKSIDLGIGYGSETESAEDESSELEESSVVSSSEESLEESESESDSDSDAPPEEQSSKMAIPTVKPPPPPLVQTGIAANEKRKNICVHWKKTGKCRHGDHCRYSHPPKQEPKRMGLYEKMVEQELEKADRLALDAITYLGQHGFLG